MVKLYQLTEDRYLSISQDVKNVVNDLHVKDDK
jgi:hypothetical protein